MAYDYPDFLPQKQASNVRIGSFDATVTGVVTIPAVDLTPFQEALIFVTNLDASAIMELTIGFLGGLIDPTPDPMKTIVFNGGQSGAIRVPALRETMQILVTPHGAVATQHLQVGIYGMIAHTHMYDLYTGTPTLFSASPALAANGNATELVTTWYAGPVEVAVLTDNAANCLVVFDYYDAGAGSYIEFAQYGMAGQYANGSLRITFPPYPVRIRFFNGATAQTVEIYITPSAVSGI